jgi:putative tricarboxylic transport membrane protein
MLDGILGVIDNLGNIFTLYNLAILVLGVIGGIILGALPGVSPTLAVALLVPFTFYMEAASGLIQGLFIRLPLPEGQYPPSS